VKAIATAQRVPRQALGFDLRRLRLRHLPQWAQWVECRLPPASIPAIQS
jgi:hypothetical protein